MAARNYGQALAAASAAAKYFPLFRSNDSLAVLSATRNRFDSLFPNVDMVRHSVSHPEYYHNAKKYTGSDNDFSSPLFNVRNSRNVQIQDGIIGDVFHCTFSGEHLSCLITTAAAIELAFMTHALFDGLKAAAIQGDK